MIQMCVYNSILDWETAGWPLGRLLLLAVLGDCWQAPGKVGWSLGRLLPLAVLGGCWLALGKAATAGCTGRLLAGPWEGCYCWLHWEAAGWPLERLASPWEGCYHWLHWEAAGWPLGGLAVLRDCWLAPGKAATAGCAGRLLAGPWRGWLDWKPLFVRSGL